MPKQATLSRKPKARRINGKLYWVVSGPKPGGGRFQRTFKAKEEATTFIALKRVELQNHGAAAAALSDQFRGDALKAAEILKSFNVTLTAAAEFFAEHHHRQSQSETVANAVKAFLASLNGHPRYLKDCRYRLGRFVQAFGLRKLSSLSPGELDDWLNSLVNLDTGGSLAALSRKTYALRLSALWTFAVNRGWAIANILGNVPKVKRRDDGEPGILTPEEAARLLEQAAKQSLPYWALALFCGLRSEELHRFEWRHVRFEERLVEVSGRTSKTGSRRFATMPDNLVAWLQPYRNHAGPIHPGRKALEADRERAGLLQAWKPNCCRHSFASYHLAHHGDPKLTSMELGHSRPDTLFNFYRQRVTKAEATRFWQIVPQEGANVVELAAIA
jgi:integrase